jgi:archaellum component FlaC
MDKDIKQEFETLGRAVKEGFDAVDKRFDAVDERFGAVENRLDGVEKRFDAVDKRFDGVEGRLNTVEVAVVSLQEDMKGVKETLRAHDEKFDMLLTNQDWMIGVLTRLDQERIMTVRVTDEMRKDLNDLKQRVARLETVAV